MKAEKILKVTFALVVAGSAAFAQTTADAKKAIDVEQYQKAKTMLNQLIKAAPAVGDNYFHLGQAYLLTDDLDSAKIAFTNGVAASPQFALNYVGLGAVDLEKGSTAAAQANFDKVAAQANKKDIKQLIYIGKAYTEASKPDYKTALVYLEKAKLLNPKDAELHLALGNAHRGAKDNSAAFTDYGTALELDKTLTRAKLEMGVSVKMAKAHKEAVDKFNEIVAAEPNYGPVYRELAETYWQWTNLEPIKDKDGSSHVDPEKIKMALQNYNKYMDLTDRSLESRFRHADFLMLAKQWKELETEADEMSKMDKTNLRVFRYLGTSAYENGNYPASVQAFKSFISKVDSARILPSDIAYLAKGQLATKDTLGALKTFERAIKLDSSNADLVSPVAKGLYDSKKFDLAAEAYKLVLKSPKPKGGDYYQYASTYYFHYQNKVTKGDTVGAKTLLFKADSAYADFSTRYPTTVESYLYRARIGRLLDNDLAPKGLMVPHYEKYIEMLEAKGMATLSATNKRGIIEAYNNLAAYYAPSDKVKAKALLDKTVAMDPANAYALDLLKRLSEASSAPNPK